MTSNAPPLPVEVDDLTPEWMSYALEVDVARVEVLDRHSGTTGRAHLALEYANGTSGTVGAPASVFVKLAPFDEGQRAFVNMQGMGIAEARFYRDLAAEIPVRIPRAYFAEFEGEREVDARYVMVLEDLVAHGCRFPEVSDDDIEFRINDIVENLAALHAPYWNSDRLTPDGDLAWVGARGTGAGDGGAQFVQMALDNLADGMPDGFVPLAELYVQRSRDVMALYREGTKTFIHGDPHLGNLFVDGTRTGFLDWAVIGCAPGIRDVAYVTCNSVPTEVRRADERALVAHYCELLAISGITLDRDVAWEEYRLFAIYSWVAATCTAAMGSKWQPEHIGLASTIRTTVAAVDLDCVGLLHDRL